jgi:hypothetical protein
MKKELTPEQKERIRLYKIEYRKNNKDKIKLAESEYRKANKDAINKRLKEWKKANPDKTKEYNKNAEIRYKLWVENNKERLKQYNANYRRNKKANNPLFKFKCNIQTLIYNSLINSKNKKNLRTHEILGCDIEFFKSYIESQFENWMTWDNYGLYKKDTLNYGWDIDHIKPTASATNEQDIITLNHYTNLRPLCSHINRYVKKGN